MVAGNSNRLVLQMRDGRVAAPHPSLPAGEFQVHNPRLQHRSTHWYRRNRQREQ